MKHEGPAKGVQTKFDFSAARPRPFLSSLPAKIDSYEEGVARFFRWRTGLDYYAAMDQIVDFVLTTRRICVVDLLCDTATFSLRLAGRKGFQGKVYAFDDNITLLERARQRARYLNLDQIAEFRQYEPQRWAVADGFAEIAVSIFDLHRHDATKYLSEAYRILAPEGYLLLAEVLEPGTAWNRLRWIWSRLQLRFIQKNIEEARGAYFDREAMIRMVFEAGFRQVIIQGLQSPASPHRGVFSLVAATK